jgi:cytochrome c nitrite reductase small subunit
LIWAASVSWLVPIDGDCCRKGFFMKRLLSWLLRRLPLLAVGVVIGLGLYVFSYAEGGSYFSDDPKACANCHIMRDSYDSWQKASHHGVATCNDCHVPHEFFAKYLSKAENGFFHSKAFTLQDFHEPIRIKPKNARILRENCIGCHREMVSGILGEGPHGENSTNCVRCHVSVGHGPESALAAACPLHRKAQWRVDFVVSENSRGFHAPQETLRILGEAIDDARQAQLAILRRKRP